MMDNYVQTGTTIGSGNAAALKASPTVAEEVMKYAAALAERAEMVSDRVGSKLLMVTTPPCDVAGCRGEEPQRESPPLFAELRSRFYAIERALDNIQYTLDRTQL